MTGRQLVRSAVVLLAGILAGSRAVDAVQACADARRWAISDPSAADAYRTFCQVDAAAAVVSLAIATLVWRLLRPSPPT